jgi:hypothetical protein
MKNNIKELIALANKLDSMGYSEEADMCDSIVSKASKSKSAESYFEKKAKNSLHDIVKALNEFKTIRFIFDLETQTAHPMSEWEAKKEKGSFSVVVQLEGPKDFFVKEDSGAYLVRSSDGKGYFLPGSISIGNNPCRPIEKYFRMKVVDATDSVKGERNLLASLRDEGAIGVMKDNRFNIVTAMYVQSDARGLGKLKSKLKRRSNFKSITANLQSIFDLEVKDSDPCAAIEGTEVSNGSEVTNTSTNTDNNMDAAEADTGSATEVASDSATADLVSSGNGGYKVFYYKGGKVYISDFFADDSPTEISNDKDSGDLIAYFKDSENNNDLEKWAKLNNVMIKLKEPSAVSDALDGHLDSESKIAKEFLSRLKEIRKLAGGGGTDKYSFVMTGFSANKWGSWESKGYAQLTAIAEGETYDTASSKGSVKNSVPDNISDIMGDVKAGTLNSALSQ